RIKRSKGNEFKAHQVRLAERQLLEHVVSGSRVGYVQDERDAASILKREPLVDLAVQIELHRFADFGRQDRPHGRWIDSGVDGPNREDAGRGRRRTRVLGRARSGEKKAPEY